MPRLSFYRFNGCPAFRDSRLMGVQFFGFSYLEDRQFRVVVYLVDVPIVGSAFQLLAAFLMGVQHFSFSPAF